LLLIRYSLESLDLVESLDHVESLPDLVERLVESTDHWTMMGRETGERKTKSAR
jgi:hypothetical protein